MDEVERNGGWVEITKINRTGWAGISRPDS